MALKIDQVAAVRFVAGMPEMHGAGVVERGRRLRKLAMCPPSSGGLLVGLDGPRRGSCSGRSGGCAARAGGRPGWGGVVLWGEMVLTYAVLAANGSFAPLRRADGDDPPPGCRRPWRCPRRPRRNRARRSHSSVSVGLVLDPVVHRADLPHHLYKSLSALALSSHASV